MKNNKHWIQETLAHKETGAVPYNFMFTPPARRRLEEHYGTTSLADLLDLPLRTTSPRSIKPLYAAPAAFGETLKDEYGVVWTTNESDRGAPIGPPLKEPDLSDYTFPDPSAAYRFAALGEWCAANREHFTVVWVGDLWERATFMRGMEDLLADIILNPRFVHELLQGITGCILETIAILCERFSFDAVALSDDYGAQESLLMSPDDWRKFIKPCVQQVYSLARKHGRVVFHHSCGNIRRIIGDMIDLGLDILHPIQPEAMDILALKREFGRDLTFCGGVRTQDLLPYGTPQEIREEVRKLKLEMGKGGGYILEPGITIQADVPVENMVAMIEEARAR